MIEWREGASPRILVVDGARTSQEVETQAMRDADIVACVADDIVRVVKDRHGGAGAMTVEDWMKFIRPELRRKNVQVIQVDAPNVRRTEAV